MKVVLNFAGNACELKVPLEYIPMVGDSFSYQDDDYYVSGDVIKRDVSSYMQEGSLVTIIELWVIEY